MRVSGEDTSARLRELADACDSPLVAARARHAAAARARDARGLAAVAGDFEALGATLLAAEAASGAAAAFSRAGDRRAATAAQRRASALGADCEGAVGDALLAALAVVLGDSFDAPTREAWDIAYNLVAETMLEGAAAARPIGNR
jgi:hypothetical protein